MTKICCGLQVYAKVPQTTWMPIMGRAIFYTILLALTASILITPTAMEKGIIQIEGGSVAYGILIIWILLLIGPGSFAIALIITIDGFYTRGVKFRVMDLLMEGPKTPAQLQDQYIAKWKKDVRLSKILDALSIALKQGMSQNENKVLTAKSVIRLTPKGVAEVQDARRYGEAGLEKPI